MMNYASGFLISAIILGMVIPAGAVADAVGGDQGWYSIHCNVYGAKVYFDDHYVGTTEQGSFTVPASTTGTPYKTFRVEKNGYTVYTSPINLVPAKGMTVDLYATLNAIPETTQTRIGGDMGWYIVHCNVEGATVQFDSSNKGEISQGQVYVPVYTTGTPYHTLTVTKDGYITYTTEIKEVPAKGEAIDLYVTLNPVTPVVTTSPSNIGGDIGWYTVHCNENGATVSFNNEEKGKIADGKLTVQVYVTGTPYKTVTVFKAGYAPYTATIDKFPGKGETIDLYATLNPASGEQAATSPTAKSPLSALVILVALSAVAGYLKYIRETG